MFAYIPARGSSKRVPRKNIRVLGSKPLLGHVLEALGQVSELSGVAVSSDDPEILEYVSRYHFVSTLEPREQRLANDAATFMDLVRSDVPRYARHFGDEGVLFVMATAALVTTEIYRDAIHRFQLNPRGLVMAVTRYEPSPMLALVGDPQAGLKPLYPDMYVRPTKDLPAAFADVGCFYGFDLNRIRRAEKFIDLVPTCGVVLPAEMGIDVDTEDDWRRLERAYEAGRRGMLGD